jgi:integrase
VRSEIRLHDFRALYVTESLAAGVDAGSVARQVGHARPDFTRGVYQRARREDARPAANAIDRALGATFATPSVDKSLTGTDGVVIPMKRKRG